MVPECIKCKYILTCQLKTAAKDGKCIKYKPRKEEKEKNN